MLAAFCISELKLPIRFLTLIFDFAIVSVDHVCGNKDGAEGHCQTSFHKVGIMFNLLPL